MIKSKEITIEKTAYILKLLGDKTRLTMMKILSEQEFCVCEFVEIFRASQPAISQHLRKLKDAGLIKENRRGQWIYYSLNKDHEYEELISLLLDALPSQKCKIDELEVQGKRITCD